MNHTSADGTVEQAKPIFARFNVQERPGLAIAIGELVTKLDDHVSWGLLTLE